MKYYALSSVFLALSINAFQGVNPEDSNPIAVSAGAHQNQVVNPA